MTLVKTSLLSLVATVFRLVSGLVITKTLSMYLGPAGLGLVGQFQSFYQFIIILSQAGINTGVTKYTAEYNNNNVNLGSLFSTAIRIGLIASTTASIVLLIWSNELSLWIFKVESYRYVFVIFGLTLFLYVLNNLLLSILNGLKQVRKYVYINILQSIYGLIFTTVLIILFGLDGILVALVTNQSVILCITLYLLRKKDVINFHLFRGNYDKTEGRRLLSFALMSLTTALVVPMSHFVIRSYIGENLGWDQAGYWQAIWYVSTTYLTVVTSVLTIYFLPRFSEITEKKLLKKEILSGYKLIMPLIVVVSLIIYLLRDVVIWLLFTEEFTEVRDLFFWQLIGDVLRVACLFLGYLIVAKALTKLYIFTEIAFGFSFVMFSILFVEYFGLVGVTYSFAISYFLHFIMMFIVTKKLFN